MESRFIVGMVALACVPAFGLLSTIASSQMVDKVNSRLPEEQQFPQLGWHLPRTLRLHSEYNRLYPSGRLSRKVRVLVGLMFSCLLTCAWSFGFFGR